MAFKQPFFVSLLYFLCRLQKKVPCHMEESLNFQILCEYSGFDESLTSEAFFILTFCVPF